MLRKPKGDENTDTEGGGGLSSVATSELPSNQRLPGEDEDESDDSGVSSSDADFYRIYHKLDGNGGRRKSASGTELDKIEEENKKADDDREGNFQNKATAENKGQSDKEEKAPTEEEDLEQLLSLNVDEVVTSKGKPISKASSDVMNRFKKSLTKLSEQLKAAQAGGSADPQLTEKLTKLEEENSRLQDSINEELFEKSDAFKAAFISPVDAKLTEIQDFFSELDEDRDSEEFHSVNKQFSILNKLAKEGKEIAFMKAVDQMAEDSVDGGRSIKNMFSTRMSEFFKLVQDREKAFSEKGANRKQVLEAKLASQRASNVSSVDKRIDSHIRAFEVSKRPVLDGLTGQRKQDYINLYQEKAKKAKSGISDFAITGSINDDLHDIIQSGVTADAIKHENELAWLAFKDSNNRISILEKEKSALEKKLSDLSEEPDGSRGTHSNSPKKKVELRPGGSAIFAALQSLGKE